MEIKINCHVNAPHYGDKSQDEWREPDHNKRKDAYAGQPFRTCSYCGSMHPEDLLNYLKNHSDQIKVSGSDWKYGWPHKFYISVPNPTPQNEYQTGSVSQNGVTTPTMGRVESCHGKFYNEHLKDIPDGEFFDELCEQINKHFHIKFSRDEKGLKYSAPYSGYQTWTGKETNGNGNL